MGATQSKKNYEPPTDGLNDRYSPLMINQTEASVLSNFIVNDRGVLEKVKGYQKDGSPFPNDPDSFIRMLVNYKRGTTVDLLLMAAQDNANANSNYKVDFKKTAGDGTYEYIGHTAGTDASFTNASAVVTGTATNWDLHLKPGDKIKATAHADAEYGEILTVDSATQVTLTSAYTGATLLTTPYIARIILDKTHLPRAIVLNNKCVITNGSETMMTYDNTTLNLIQDADAPKAKFIEAHKSRVFAASTSGNPSTVYWSTVNDETAWDAAGAEPIYPNDNGNIVAIKSFADSLIVLKNNGNIYQVVGDFDDSAVGEPQFIRRIDTPTNIGIIAERSCVVHTDGLYFLTETGIWKLDQRLYLQKISYNIDGIVDETNFGLAPSQAKSYLFDTKSQWDTGTYDGLLSTTGGSIKNYFDLLTITDAWKSDGMCSVAIDNNNDVHIAYVDSANHRLIHYKKWLASTGVVSISETINAVTYDLYLSIAGVATVNTVFSLSIDVDSSGVPGIAWISSKTTTIAACYAMYSKRTAGTWITNEVMNPGSAAFSQPYESKFVGELYDMRTVFISLRFRTDGEPIITFAFTVDNTQTGRIDGYVYYGKRTAGSWSLTQVLHDIASGIILYHGAMYLASDTLIKFVVNDSNSRIRMYSVILAGAITLVETVSSAGVVAGNAALQMQKTSTDHFITAFCSSGVLKKRDHTGATTTTLDAATNNRFVGFRIDAADKNYYYRSNAGVEKYTYDALSATNGSATTGTVSSGDRGMHNHGRVYASAIFGANSNEILVRRVSFNGTWTSPVESDATLTAWGTYNVGNPVSNGNSIVYTSAVSTTGSLPTQTAITNGAIVSTDAAKVYFQTTITVNLTSFSGPSVIDSLEVHYTGSGVDARQPVGDSFNTEFYIALSQPADASNAHMIMYDFKQAWMLLTHPASAFCRYKNKLYAGKSSNGDLIILFEGYKFDDASYTAEYVSKEDFLESIDLEKDIYKIYVLYEVKVAGSFTFGYRLDNFKNSFAGAWKNTAIDQTKDGIYEIPVGNKAHTIQCRVLNANLDEQCGVIGFVIVYGYLKQR